MPIFEIEFNHPDYSALDFMHLGMNVRFVEACTIEGAVQIFREDYPKFSDTHINSIKEATDLSSIDQLLPYYIEINNLDRVVKCRRILNNFERIKGRVYLGNLEVLSLKEVYNRNLRPCGKMPVILTNDPSSESNIKEKIPNNAIAFVPGEFMVGEETGSGDKFFYLSGQFYERGSFYSRLKNLF